MKLKHLFRCSTSPAALPTCVTSSPSLAVYNGLTVSSTTLDLASPSMIALYEPVIGLEVHVQLVTATKIFCGCPTSFGASPNTNVCPVCLGLPGALPVISRHAVELAICAGLALNCQIRTQSRFAR